MQISLRWPRMDGAVCAPPSKSMAHRALIAAALANGESRIANVAASADMRATCGALAQLGAEITPLPAENAVCVRGVGGLPFLTDGRPVDCGESGSTLRFLIPLFSLSGKPVEFTAHGRLPERPQTVYETLFRARGLHFAQTPRGVALHGALGAGEYTIDGSVSSQFISGLLFALPLLDAPSVLHIAPPFESRSYVALTLRALADFGVHAEWLNEYTLSIQGNQKYTPCNYTVEGDASQAAFFAVLGAVRGGIVVSGLRADSQQGDRVIFDILARCGARITYAQDGLHFTESALNATHIDLADCPDLGPVLMTLGLFCEGETVITNAGRLRLKESDRIAAMQTELAKLGGCVLADGDTVTVRGIQPLHAAHTLDSHNDHRVAMALCVAAAGANVPITLADAQCVEKSYPDFYNVLETLGAEVTYETA